jgi:hypothetical protein
MITAKLRQAQDSCEIDFAELMEAVALWLLGEPKQKFRGRREWRYGTRGSLKIDIDRGTWTDFEAGTGGGVLDFISREIGGGRADAMSWLRREGLTHDARPVRPRPRTMTTAEDDAAERSAFALQLWERARDPRGTIVQTYLASRKIALPEGVAGTVIRFHPALKFENAVMGGMVALFRDIETDKPCAIHRTFLDDAGRKLGRKMLGRAGGGAIKLDADENVTLGLTIGEGVETCLAALLAGQRPVWALGSSGGIKTFPALPGIDAITILAEVGDGGANHRAVQECADRWIKAGREVLKVAPLTGADFNDVWGDTQ